MNFFSLLALLIISVMAGINMIHSSPWLFVDLIFIFGIYWMVGKSNDRP
jgi:hypothetical protein